MRIARVFPTKTNMSPTDRDAYFGLPELGMPPYHEVHISVAFTWDIGKANWLKRQWDHVAPVKIGGPAIDGEPTDGFQSGIYLKSGVTITSRGCPFRCPWCLVEQDLIELDDFPEGSIIQDNNLLACSKSHLDRVFNMLSHQKNIEFSGGLDVRLLNDKTIDRLRELKINQIFVAYDDTSRYVHAKYAIENLRKYFTRNQVRCFVLIGFCHDSFQFAEERLLETWNWGALPFAMLYRNKKGDYPEPEDEWRRFQRTWCRPAAIKTKIKELKKASGE